MLYQTRNAKIFASMLISVIIGTLILKALGSKPPSAGAFSLSEYYHLEPVEEVSFSDTVQSTSQWNRIEIYYSTPKINQPPSAGDQANYNEIDCHFIIYNGVIGGNGQIQSTKKWQRQLSITPGRSCNGGEHTIRICIIADGKIIRTTDFQIKRAEALVEVLSRKFSIAPASIYYPDNW